MSDPQPQVHLTPREQEVLVRVGWGLSTKEIALALEIAPKTVDGHVERMRLKMGAHNRSHLIGLAAGMGLLAPGGEAMIDDTTG